MQNHIGRFRPVRGGIAIVNPLVNQFGTLGLIATSDGADAWLVSAFHVLCQTGAPLDGQTIFQPSDENPADSIAKTSAARAFPLLDCAAALLSVPHVPEMLGIGKPGPASPPLAGMEVIKSGVATGVTEGIIESVNGDAVTIKVTAGFPKTYDLSNRADSGSIWIEKSTRRAVALHTGGNAFGSEFATAARLAAVLLSLNLRLP